MPPFLSLDAALERLQATEARARGSRLDRLRFHPLRYLLGMGFCKGVYPLSGRPWKARAATFWGAELRVWLPAGLDIYLLGAKSHDSEIRLARFLLRHLKPGDHVVDIGAHLGFFSLLAAYRVGNAGKVLAVEPAASVFPLLQENLAPYLQATPVNAAAADQAGAVTFAQYPAQFSEYNAIFRDEPAEQSPATPALTSVQAITLDQLLEQYGIRPAIVKIDTEGAEAAVLRGMRATLQQQSAWIIMEYLAGRQDSGNYQEALDIAASAGYLPYIIDAKGDLLPPGDVEASLNSRGLDSDNLVLISSTGK